MSALAHTNKHQANLASVQLDSEPAVTSISVSARIEYIQRFSKQAVLVIDDEVAIYSQAASHYLANLSSSSSKVKVQEESNVAFISASTKLNDIQMRCRIIEQLFSNTLFDPEKSLVVSVIQLTKKNTESITIVVEHAHALSLQIKFELCQLVEIANKTHNKINVVLFGQEQAAQEVSINKTIFTNKLTIIDAKSGQLFALDHAKFKNGNSSLSNKFWQKALIALVVICLAIGCSWFLLMEHDNFTLAKLPVINQVVNEKAIINKNFEKNEALAAGTMQVQASINDINNALLARSPVNTQVQDKPAQTTDILQALSLNKRGSLQTAQILPSTESVVTEAQKTTQIRSTQENSESSHKTDITDTVINLTTNYYLHQPTGYVIQFAGFKKLETIPQFINELPNLEYYSYQRLLNEQPFIVLTSKVFTDKIQAKQAIEALPESILKRGPWLKPISEIKQEINTFTP